MAIYLFKSGAAVAAVAASSLFAESPMATPAHAESTRFHIGAASADAHISVHLGDVHKIHHRSRSRRSGYYYDDRAQRRFLRRACRAAIRDKAHYIGFRAVDFDSRGRVNQIGPRRFEVFFGDVDFEGRRRILERSVRCEVARGQVRFVEGVPKPRRRAYRGYGY